ncbi:hypothetical protein KKB40_03365, partial [Patescibacteria group bacterium]|nr:hypothetical protein [Patescibacteria group bacterium]
MLRISASEYDLFILILNLNFDTLYTITNIFMGRNRFEQSMTPQESIKKNLEDFGISDPQEWRKAVDLETPPEEEKAGLLSGENREVDIKKFDQIFTYLEGGLRVIDKAKIERFGTLKDGMDRLKALQSMSIVEASEAIRDFGLTGGAWNYLARRLEFYQKFVSGKATKK